MRARMKASSQSHDIFASHVYTTALSLSPSFSLPHSLIHSRKPATSSPASTAIVVVFLSTYFCTLRRRQHDE